jgi:nitrate reductase (cytochrome), electron transfer subunit
MNGQSLVTLVVSFCLLVSSCRFEDQTKISERKIEIESESKAEAQVFRSVGSTLSKASNAESAIKTNHKKYYDNRAYPGAPPRIPHPVTSEQHDLGKQCMSCHRFGGYAPTLAALASKTPHPELVHCRQCHVPGNERELFTNNFFQKPAPPKTGNALLVGGPPPIPHSLQMRENCVGCHNSPGGLISIQTSHPERLNCRQCHVPQTPGQKWERTGT